MITSPGRTKETSFLSAKKALFLGVKELLEAAPVRPPPEMPLIEASTWDTPLFWSDLLHGGSEMLASAMLLYKFVEAIRHRDHASLLRTDRVNRNESSVHPHGQSGLPATY